MSSNPSAKCDFTFIASAALLCFSAGAASAADRVEPGPQDTREYLCAVMPINPDGSGSNLWTNAARGGKFEAVSTRKIRVASSSPEAAANELYAFYQATAPQYRGIDRGRSPQSHVVETCVDDPSSTRGVKIQAVPLERYRFLQHDKEFIEFFLALNKDPLSDEQLIQLYDRTVRMPSDAFEKRAFIQKQVAGIREKIKATPSGPIAVSSRLPSMARPYDFDKNQFDLGDLTRVEYGYTTAHTETVMPSFNVSDPAKLRFYKPASIEEAKQIEQARVAGSIAVRTYIQPTRAWLQDGRPQINGVIAAIELRDKKGAVLARAGAR